MLEKEEYTCCPKSIRRLRARKGYSLDDVAAYLGIPSDMLQEFENNPEDIPIAIANKLLRLYRAKFETVCFRPCRKGVK